MAPEPVPRAVGMRSALRGLAIIATADLFLVAGAAAQSNHAVPTNDTQAVAPRNQDPPADKGPVAVTISTDKPLAIANASPAPPMSPWTMLSSLAPVIALIGSLIVVYIGNRQSAKNTSAALNSTAANAQAAINQKANELEVQRIERWLTEFFGPFMQLSEENKRIAELLRSRQPDPSFRTLRALLDLKWKKSASGTDLNLISRIVGTGMVLRTLIREKAGPTSPALSQYLSRAAAHWTILELADAGALTERTQDFEDYVYPRELDPVLNLERERLESRRDQLLTDLSKRHPAPQALVIPADLALDDEPQRRNSVT